MCTARMSRPCGAKSTDRKCDVVEVVRFIQPFVARVVVFAVAGHILVGEIVAGDGGGGADAGDCAGRERFRSAGRFWGLAVNGEQGATDVLEF